MRVRREGGGIFRRHKITMRLASERDVSVPTLCLPYASGRLMSTGGGTLPRLERILNSVSLFPELEIQKLISERGSSGH